MNEEVQPARRYVKARLLELQQHAEEMQRLIRWALREIANLDAIRIRRWRCTHCGHVTAFSKPSTIEACGKCPKCKGEKFVPDGETTPLSD
jgi:rubrerythrin